MNSRPKTFSSSKNLFSANNDETGPANNLNNHIGNETNQKNNSVDAPRMNNDFESNAQRTANPYIKDSKQEQNLGQTEEANGYQSDFITPPRIRISKDPLQEVKDLDDEIDKMSQKYSKQSPQQSRKQGDERKVRSLTPVPQHINAEKITEQQFEEFKHRMMRRYLEMQYDNTTNSELKAKEHHVDVHHETAKRRKG